MAIALELAADTTTNFTGGSTTVSYTPQNVSGNNRLLMVVVPFYSNQVGTITTTVTYNGNSARDSRTSSRGFSMHDSIHIALFDDADMPAGLTAADVSVTCTGGGTGETGIVYVLEFTGVDQATPVSEWGATNLWAYGSTTTTFTPSSPGDIQFIAVSSATTDYSFSNPGGDSTARSDYTYNNGGFRVNLAVFYATDGSVDAKQSGDNTEENQLRVALNGAGPSVSTVNSESAPAGIQIGESITISGSGFDGTTESAVLTETSVGDVTQSNYSVTNDTTASIFSLTRGNLPTDTAGRTVNLEITTDGETGVGFEVAISVESGWSDVLAATPVSDSTSIFSLLPEGTTAANNDVAEWKANLETAITGVTATNANPVVLTVTQSWNDGDVLYASGFTEMTELNGNYYKVNNVTGTTVELQTLAGVDVDGTSYTAETTGGSVQRAQVWIAANGVVTCTSLPQTTSWRFWDESANELSTTGTVTISEAGVEEGTGATNVASMSLMRKRKARRGGR